MMTGELYLYPEILETSWNIRGRWTILRGLLCIGLLWKFRPRAIDTEADGDDSEIFSPGVYQHRLDELSKDIGTKDTQSRYREYQQLIREIVQKKYGIDISSMTLKSLKYSHTGLRKSLVDLLEQSYYYPYNLESGDITIMQDEIQRLSRILLD